MKGITTRNGMRLFSCWNIAHNMPLDTDYLALGLSSLGDINRELNHRPPTWPPPDDFPIVVDAKGTVVSRYADSC